MAPNRAGDGSSTTSDGWANVPGTFRSAAAQLPSPWEELFGPLRAARVDELLVVGQIGQSLDGRVATETGHSHYINGPAGLAHLHRLRALVDAVVIGVGTALADDPRLTVRRVSGPQPARVVIDPSGRLPGGARIFADDGVRRIVIAGSSADPPLPSGIEVVRVPKDGGMIAPAEILRALAQRGFRRLLIEGGANTLSRFLAAGCLDRLHVMVAPVILGSGRASFALPAVERADQGLRPPVRVHKLDDEVLFDCDLSGHRVVVGRANKSK